LTLRRSKKEGWLGKKGLRRSRERRSGKRTSTGGGGIVGELRRKDQPGAKKVYGQAHPPEASEEEAAHFKQRRQDKKRTQTIKRIIKGRDGTEGIRV